MFAIFVNRLAGGISIASVSLALCVSVCVCLCIRLLPRRIDATLSIHRVVMFTRFRGGTRGGVRVLLHGQKALRCMMLTQQTLTSNKPQCQRQRINDLQPVCQLSSMGFETVVVSF